MLTHQGTQILRTARLTLRPFTPADALPMFETWANDERVTRYLTWTPHGSPELTKQLLADWCARYEDPACYNWAMELAGRLIGNISVVRLDERSEWAELGYCMGFDFWGRGLMSEAARAVTDFLFDKVGVNCVRIEHAVENPASGGVSKNCGMTLEGTLRAYHKAHDGRFLDISYWSILRTEWEERNKMAKIPSE